MVMTQALVYNVNSFHVSVLPIFGLVAALYTRARDYRTWQGQVSKQICSLETPKIIITQNAAYFFKKSGVRNGAFPGAHTHAHIQRVVMAVYFCTLKT
jgi:hypothetical protein